MPISAEAERRLLNHYKLTTLYPDAWPSRDGESSEEEDDLVEGSQSNGNTIAPAGSNALHKSHPSLSKYQHQISSSPSLKGSTSTVQKDEPDPLGAKPSVAVELKRRGLPIEDNLNLRDRFMLSSTTFSPALFLSQVHQDASVEDLMRGLDFLSNSIEQKSASLKVLVESNFERFVRAKSTIDNVYAEMRMQGVEDESSRPQSRIFGAGGSTRPHSRQVSKGQHQTHFRGASNPQFPGSRTGTAVDRKKNALTKESEYGVSGIKVPLQEVALRAEEVWGPALGGRDKEEALRVAMSTLEHHRDVFHLNGNMAEAVRKNDYDTIIDLFRQAKKHAAAARRLAESAKLKGGPLPEQDAQLIILTARMWHDANEQVTTFKRNIKRRLKSSHSRQTFSTSMADDHDKEGHMEIIAALIQLGVDSEDNNPIWEWLHSRYIHLKEKIAQLFERSRIDIEILRRKLATVAAKSDATTQAKYLRCVATAQTPAGRLNNQAGMQEMDEPSIILFWEKVLASLTAILSKQDGIVSEIVEYWETTLGFINNTAQKAFPIAVFATGSDSLELEPDDVANLRSGVTELVNQIRENIMGFFADPPVDDISALYSPILPAPITPNMDEALSANGPKHRFSFDLSNIPPPSPLKGDPWEKFAFWPPAANSLSGSHYLARIVAVVGCACAEMASMTIVKQAKGNEPLKSLVGVVRERCIQALCAAWHIDAERCKILETWTRSVELRDLTTFPTSLCSFMEKVLSDAQKIAYIPDAVPVRGSAEVIVPPPTKLLQALRGTFVTSLYKILSGMVENAENDKSRAERDSDVDGVTISRDIEKGIEGVMMPVDSNNKNIRVLLTLSNIAHLRSEVIPHLITQFETTFSVKLTDETKSVHDVLGHIDSQLFQVYVQPTVSKLDRIIHSGIRNSSWMPQSPGAKPQAAKPYIYDVLLTLVLVHSEVSSTAAGLTSTVLSYDLEQASRSLMAAFQQHPKYTLPALMQATLDVEFLAQMLIAYTTDRVSEVQLQIYLALDERTDNDARARLQAELPEMRSVLKRLREATKGEFGCFRRERRGREKRSEGGSSKAI